MDQRGKHANRPNRVPDDSKNYVREHINKFPRYVSHYRRNATPNRRYITAVSSLQELYRHYTSECGDSGKTPVSLSLYRYIFNTEFSISFRVPLHDTCKFCDKSIVANKESTEYKLHLAKAEAAKSTFKSDKEQAKCDDAPAVFTFDLQQALPTPMISTSVVFYLRQLWTFNLGIHLCDTDEAVMCVWPEHFASRGADEISSCLLKALPYLGNKKHLIFWTDSCSGQNKNFKMFAFWQTLVKSGLYDRIDHKFFVPGHSYMDSDRDFGLIEKKKKQRKYVYTHDDWAELIATTRVNKPFKVIKMSVMDFKSFDLIEKAYSKLKVTEDGTQLKVRNVSCVTSTKEHPDKLRVKYHYSEVSPTVKVNIKKKAKNRYQHKIFLLKVLVGGRLRKPK